MILLNEYEEFCMEILMELRQTPGDLACGLNMKQTYLSPRYFASRSHLTCKVQFRGEHPHPPPHM